MAGNASIVSSVPKVVQKSITNKPLLHTVVFDLRTMKSVQDITDELTRQKISYRFVKKVDNGYECKERLFVDKIYKTMLKLQNNDLKLRFEINPGATDTGRIYRSCSNDIKKKFLPITTGPGSRSQRNAIPPRMTHGVNETFDKKSGLAAVQFITQVIKHMKFI